MGEMQSLDESPGLIENVPGHPIGLPNEVPGQCKARGVLDQALKYLLLGHDT